MSIKTITLAIIILSLSGSCLAKATNKSAGKKESTGFFSGLAVGAAAGGPPGAIIGAIVGALTGDSLDEKDQQQLQLVQLKKEVRHTRQQLISAKEALDNPQRVLKLEKMAHQEFAQKISSDLRIDVLFRTNSVNLEPRGRTKIQPIASLMKTFPELTVNLLGYADSRGTSIKNLALSLQRAKTVQQALIKMGVDAKRIKIEGLGERFARANATDIEGTALDRHVAINFSTPQTDPAIVSRF